MASAEPFLTKSVYRKKGVPNMREAQKNVFPPHELLEGGGVKFKLKIQNIWLLGY